MDTQYEKFVTRINRPEFIQNEGGRDSPVTRGLWRQTCALCIGRRSAAVDH